MLRSLTLLLTHRCNLHCSYCYQSRRCGSPRMSWRTARTAIDLLVAGAPDRCAVELSGGEPTLEPALLRRCVRRLRSSGPIGEDADCSLATNGTLLDDGLLSFLVEHDVRVDLSSDGVAAAQDLRARGTFATLDRLFLRIRRRHPEHLHRRLVVRLVVQQATLPLLAASVRYLIERGVGRLLIAPRVLDEPPWSEEDERVLRDEVRTIVELSLRHAASTGRVPVGFLSPGAAAPRDRDAAARCAAVAGTTLCVDAAGGAWGCPMLAASLRKPPAPATSASAAVSLGSVHDPDLLPRLQTLPGRARSHPLFSSPTMGGGSARCRDCDVAPECFVCPAVMCEGTRPEVPGHVCAFNRIVLEGRRAFLRAQAEAGGGRCPEDVTNALRDVVAAFTAPAEPSTPGSRPSAHAATGGGLQPRSQ